MYQSNPAYKNSEIEIPERNYFVSEISKFFNLSDYEIEKLENNCTAKIIASIPFAANCFEPKRTTIAHICLYLAEIKGFQKYCSHKHSDNLSVMNRLSFIFAFGGGDKKSIEHGMNMLAYIMIESYHNSMLHDKENNIHAMVKFILENVMVEQKPDQHQYRKTDQELVL